MLKYPASIDVSSIMCDIQRDGEVGLIDVELKP